MSMGIAKRITLGFGGLLILLGVLVVVSHFQVDEIAEVAQINAERIETENFLFHREIDHRNWVDKNFDSAESMVKADVVYDPRKCKFGTWLYSELESKKTPEGVLSTLKKIEPHHAELHKKGEELATAIDLGDKELVRHKFSEIQNAVKKTAKAFSEVHTSYDTFYKEKAKHLKSSDTAKVVQTSQIVMGVLGIVSFAIGLFLASLVGRSIIGALKKITTHLTEITNGLASSAMEVASSSQELSGISTEQASSVEETSSSLEEIDGMVQNNVTNAAEATRLSGEVSKLSERGNESMSKLELAMKEILESNNKIVELVKVISNIGEKTRVMDEIVFQTKLLSFNASVEAERAGEYGRGFAVVAQEVGNLAQMSGKSAREIADIVKGSIKSAEQITSENRQKVDQGGALVNETGTILREIMTASVSMSSGASQVLDASKDQAKGIKQINEAIVQIDKVTQETAATAEKTSSSSEALSAQATSLKEVVEQLAQLVGSMQAGEPRQKATPVTRSLGNKGTNTPEKIRPSSPSPSTKSGNDGWESL